MPDIVNHRDRIQTTAVTDGRGTRYVVSQGGSWIPGVYESRETAVRATKELTPEQVQTLSARVCSVHREDRVITAADIEEALGK